jgi:hypothetical protein
MSNVAGISYYVTYLHSYQSNLKATCARVILMIPMKVAYHQHAAEARLVYPALTFFDLYMNGLY